MPEIKKPYFSDNVFIPGYNPYGSKDHQAQEDPFAQITNQEMKNAPSLKTWLQVFEIVMKNMSQHPIGYVINVMDSVMSELRTKGIS